MKTCLPQWILYSLCPVDDETTRRDNWWQHDSGRKRVEAEARKIIEYVKAGVIQDSEI
ncbi:hypothetical protein HFN20_24680 [Paenibacillus dendritiformis]|uniref:hypothetical protein n=1 Tax=Paenibacillus dendritiformis TaxID=130049 RepID=UPI00143DF434|nr:hypothetical protein [Paenibacillus dendritiformis]NKI24364.1 hypothetical protein [Paenibacillus dendritiformis]NRF98209.1 hypothetical protein [Paenibacillus dendritiformis]